MLTSSSAAYGLGMRCVIVVPTFTEAATISSLLDALVSGIAVAPDGTRIDVLVVDDSSPDGTGTIVQGHPAFGDRIRLLTRTTNDGLGAVYRAGFAAAVDAGYDVVVQMDADGSHPASEVPAMLAVLRRHDVVIGSRYIAGGLTQNWPARRRALSWAANVYTRGVLGLRTRDTTSGFRAWRAAALAGAGLWRPRPTATGSRWRTRGGPNARDCGSSSTRSHSGSALTAGRR